jgi:hypothetical protein
MKDAKTVKRQLKDDVTSGVTHVNSYFLDNNLINSVSILINSCNKSFSASSDIRISCLIIKFLHKAKRRKTILPSVCKYSRSYSSYYLLNLVKALVFIKEFKICINIINIKSCENNIDPIDYIHSFFIRRQGYTTSHAIIYSFSVVRHSRRRSI